MAHYGGPQPYPPAPYGSHPPSYPPNYQPGQPPYAPQQYPQPPYQQPPYGQPGYQPGSSYQSHPPPQHSHHVDRPPKRQKGNPVITRYAPPPGYRPPPSGQPFTAGQNQHPSYPPPPPPQNWQPPPSTYSQHPAWPQQPHYQQPPPTQPPNGPPVAYPHHPNQPPQGWQHQQAAYGPPPPPPPPVNYPQPPPYPPHQVHSVPPPSPHYPPNQQWPQPPPQPGPYAANNGYPANSPSQPPYQGSAPMLPPADGPHGSRQGSRSSATHGGPRPSMSGVESVVVDEADRVNFGHNDPLDLRYLDWDFDFDGPIWPKANEDVDQSLSIGIIIWHPAVPQTRALLCQFEEAERLAKQTLPKSYGNGESVSKYFTLENSHEAFLDIQQTDEWPELEGDLIFRKFTDIGNMIDLQTVMDNRTRPDEEDGLRKFRIDMSRVISVAMGDPLSEDVEMEDGEFGAEDARSMDESLNRQNSNQERATFSEDNRQEDILASLGVTGIPKAVYPTPGPARPQQATESPERRPSFNRTESSTAISPPVPQYRHHYEPPNSARSSLSKQGYRERSRSPPPPPPPLERSPSPADPWLIESRNGARHHSPARSTGSQHTAAGSDFDGPERVLDKNGPPQPPKSMLSEISRKRSYEDVDNDDHDGKLRQYDDVTPRLKRRQPRVEAAYSRR